jgi:hypothetical protein
MTTEEMQRRSAPSVAPTRESAPTVPRPSRIAQGWITSLSLLISVLALAATAAGILTANGAHHRAFLSLRGETVSLQGGGLYANESVSGAAQAIGLDVITLFVGIPLLLAAIYLAAKGSLRGRLLRAGVLWYFAYTYLLMAFGGVYNPFFLVYVALYSASIFAFVLSLLSIDVSALPALFARRFARRSIAWLVIGIGALLGLLWLGRILPSLASGTPPPGLESYSTLFVQAGDLGLEVPLAMLTGVLLLRRHPAGYLLASVLLVKGTTLGLGLLAMAVAMALAGVAIVPAEAAFFAIVAILCGVGTMHLLRCLPSHAA